MFEGAPAPAADPAVTDDERDAIGQRPGKRKPKPEADAHGKNAAKADTGHGPLSLFSSTGGSIRLDPIVASIGEAGSRWIRIELALVFQPGEPVATDAEKLDINEAVVGMMRSRSPTDLEGPSGFLHFREDLTDIVMLSTGGRASAAKILSMVLE
jgi:hypothetical protein